MWGKNANFLGGDEFGNGQMKPREIHDPGTYYEYNDVRINRRAVWSSSACQLITNVIGAAPAFASGISVRNRCPSAAAS